MSLESVGPHVGARHRSLFLNVPEVCPLCKKKYVVYEEEPGEMNYICAECEFKLAQAGLYVSVSRWKPASGAASQAVASVGD